MVLERRLLRIHAMGRACALYALSGQATAGAILSERSSRNPRSEPSVRPLDWILLSTCAALLVIGPAMALHEWSRHDQAAGLAEITGEPVPLEPAFRTAWRTGILVAVIVAGIAGTLVALRIARQPRVRAVSHRLIWLLLAGMTLLDLAFLADGRWFLNAPYAIRGSTIVWLYPAAAILMGGSVVRLTELEEAFAEPGALRLQAS